jgi:uncharacterized protein (UPF0179 family)
VIDSPVQILISADSAIKNTRLRYESPCSRTKCPNYELCSPPGINEGEKYVVTQVLGVNPEPCEMNRSLKFVELMPA